jgi:hypothetical protein
MNSLDQRHEQVHFYKTQIKKLEDESRFFEQLNIHKVLAVANTAEEVGYLQQLLSTHRHTLSRKVLDIDSRIAVERSAITNLEAQAQESSILPPAIIPCGAVVLIKRIVRSNSSGWGLRLASVASFTIRNGCKLH